MNKEVLHVIVPYFNHTNARVNRRNLELCLRNLSITPDCRVVLVEGIWNREAALPDFSSPHVRHLKFDLQSPIWVKENLINLGIASLGEEGECAAWIDKDIQFLNPEWASETVRRLKDVDILQPWSRALFLDEDHEVEKELKKTETFDSYQGSDDSKGVMSFHAARQLGDPDLGHPGNAWAISRTFFRKIGGLFDRCIIGGGDSFLVAHIDNRYRGGDSKVAENYGRFAEEQAFLFRDVRAGGMMGTIVHHHHGEMGKRNYLERYGLLRAYGFDVENDLSYAENGTLKLSNPGLEKAILEYFHSRNEHLIP
jgi:hypothetical protein